MAKKEPRSNTPKDDVLETALKRYRDSYDYQKDNWHANWERDNKLYDNERYNATYDGVTDTFVPMVYSTIETMVSALNNADLRIDFTNGDPMANVSTAPLNALIDEWWDDDQWDLSLEDSYRETLKVGMDANMLIWDIDHPHLESFAMRDAILDPTVKNPAQLQEPGHYAGRRYYVRKGSLSEFEVVDTDPKSKTYGELVKRYKDVDDSLAPSGELTDKELKEMFGSSTLKSAADDQDEIIEIWDVDRVVTIKNRSAVIENVVNPFKRRHESKLRQQYLAELDDQVFETPEAQAEAIKDAEANAKARAKGVVPFFFFRNTRKKSLIYATSEVQPIAKEQELLNDMTNMESDFIIRQLAPQRELDPAYEDWLDLIDDDPSTVYPFKPGSLTNIAPPVLPANSFNNRMNIKNEIRETTAIDQVAKGAANVKDTTATEIRAQLSQTGARIESKARIFKKDGFYWMGFILMKMIQLYVDKPYVVSVPGNEVDRAAQADKYGLELPPGTAVFDPADYQGDWKPRITLEVDAESKQIESRREARENYTILIQDPTNNLSEAKTRLYPKMFNIDREDLDAIMTPAAADNPGAGVPAPAGPVAMPPQGGAAAVPGMEAVNVAA
jgi:hypothetical protein